MIQRYIVKCEVNLDAGNIITIIVHANSKRKAESIAIKECDKKGYFNIKVISCNECEEGATK